MVVNGNYRNPMFKSFRARHQGPLTVTTETAACYVSDMTKKTDGPSDLTVYVAFLIEQKRAEKLTWRKIGAAWGVTHAHVHQIASHLKEVGQDFETRLAGLLAGDSVDRLRSMAHEWRATNPHWLPREFTKRHRGAQENSGWSWWARAAKAAVRRKPELDWAIEAAGALPQGPEPRIDRRNANYVLRLTEQILDLPDDEQRNFENAFRRRQRKKPPAPASGGGHGNLAHTQKAAGGAK